MKEFKIVDIVECVYNDNSHLINGSIYKIESTTKSATDLYIWLEGKDHGYHVSRFITLTFTIFQKLFFRIKYENL